MNWLLKMDFPAVEVDSKWLAARDIVEINTERGGRGRERGSSAQRLLISQRWWICLEDIWMQHNKS